MKKDLYKSSYLDFVPNSEAKIKGYYDNDIIVYTKKTKKPLIAGFIRVCAYEFWGEVKFIPKDNIFFGKHCLLALSRYMNLLDKELERTKQNGKINKERYDNRYW